MCGSAYAPSSDCDSGFLSGIWFPPTRGAEDRVEHDVQILGVVFGEETQYRIPTLLKQPSLRRSRRYARGELLHRRF
jgi:hypothetical protein